MRNKIGNNRRNKVFSVCYTCRKGESVTNPVAVVQNGFSVCVGDTFLNCKRLETNNAVTKISDDFALYSGKFCRCQVFITV